MADIAEIHERIKSGKDPEFEAKLAAQKTAWRKHVEETAKLGEECRLHRKTFGPGWHFLRQWTKLDAEGNMLASVSTKPERRIRTSPITAYSFGEVAVSQDSGFVGTYHHGPDDCMAATICFARTLREARAMVDEALEDIEAWRAKHAEALKVHEG